MKTLKASIAIPSTVHTYSVVTEYISNWFLSRWDDDFFKTVHIDGKHVFDDFRKFDFVKILKNSKPALAIFPKLDLDFNRDMLDTNIYGLDMLMKQGKLDRAVVKDYEKNIFLGTNLQLLDMKLMAFRVGHSYTETLDMDYHLPYKIVLQLAKDAGFVVNNDIIIDIVGFLNYINSKSELPILFKLRTINQKMEFFMRFRDIDIRTSILDRISYDDGEREGMLYNNFHLEMEVHLKVPSPKLYMYYSDNDHDINAIELSNFPDAIDTQSQYFLEIGEIPKVNDQGWNQLLITDYVETENLDNVVMELEGLFESLRLKKIIEFHNDTSIDSSMYIDFKIINGDNYEVSYDIDWVTMELTINDELKSTKSTIALYVDTEYTHRTLENMDKLDDDRYIVNRVNR